MSTAPETLAKIDGAAWLQGLALLAARLTPIVALTPVFGGDATPRRLRFGIVVMLALVLLPLAMVQHVGGGAPGPRFTGLLLKEAFVGLTIALLILVIFEAFSSFGALVDSARGATFANVLDPLTQHQQSVLGVFFRQLAVVLFIGSGGYRLLIETLGDSVAKFPLFDSAPASLTGAPAIDTMLTVTTGMLEVALRLAAPVLVVMVLLDVALGIVNRLAPQMQVYFFGLTLKGSVGLLVVFAGLALTFDTVLAQFVAQIRTWVTRLGG